MREVMVILPQTPARDELRRELQQSIRDAVREARDAAREAGQAGRDAAQAAELGPFGFAQVAPSPPLDVPTAVSLYESQIVAMTREINELTAQLTPGTSEARESAVRAQLAEAVARRQELRAQVDQLLAGGTPVVAQPPEFLGEDVIPPQVVDISIAFFATCAVIAIGIPVARAWGRWLDRRGRASATAPETDERLTRIEQAIDAVAIEVERVSEGQRYTNRTIGELRGLPAPDVGQGWAVPPREPVGVERRSEK